MILIWDNGASYSDHVILFIDIGDTPEADVMADLKRRSEPEYAAEWDKAHVVAVLDPSAVTWRDPDAVWKWEAKT